MHPVTAALGDVNTKKPVRAISYSYSGLDHLLETTMSQNRYHVSRVAAPPWDFG